MSRKDDQKTVHASAVAVAGRGVLILGESGSGKSALALRLMALGAALVADDQVMLRRNGALLIASAPPRLVGLIEARGVGLLRAPAVAEAELALAVDLDRPPGARMPQPGTITILGAPIRLILGHSLPDLDSVLTISMKNGVADAT